MSATSLLSLVEGGQNTVDSQGLLDLNGTGRENQGRGVGGQDNVTQVLRRETGGLQGLTGGSHRHGHRTFLGRGNTALCNPGAFQDPVVIGINQFFQVLIAQDLIGHIYSGTQNADFFGCHAPHPFHHQGTPFIP